MPDSNNDVLLGPTSPTPKKPWAREDPAARPEQPTTPALDLYASPRTLNKTPPLAIAESTVACTLIVAQLCTNARAPSLVPDPTEPTCRRLSLPGLHDAYVRWNKVCAAQAGASRRWRMRKDFAIERLHKRILPNSIVDSPDSLENVETKWVGEIAENCPGVKLVLVALKCDLRKKEDDDADDQQPEKPCIDYNEGLRVAEKIKALRYLECSAMKNRGVNEAFTEAARVALQVKTSKDKSGGCTIL
ncbi:GTP-binding protein rho3 precursor [Stemphylium lycopersici]|uniref:GTP-binding protein rho3 n=1 Tax=Stemphylium lycopersici TaxID=183478 RepID=A0A364NDM5_STELY|nr:GTP-binding protein rho3 precursor [Stemphylium lycopersici]